MRKTLLLVFLLGSCTVFASGKFLSEDLEKKFEAIETVDQNSLQYQIKQINTALDDDIIFTNSADGMSKAEKQILQYCLMITPVY